ncbi:MAG: D-alanine--D-alanine ligase [Gammaproteobacteria bacterium]|nr:D-alanine--D-alanine ligase [Gammaproteobacteria bacterium]
MTDLPADMGVFGRVAVVMGGWSAEREVSLRSGQQILEALLSRGVDAHAVDADRHLIATLQQAGFDRVFLILHGRGGEDGTIQGALELAGIPYTGSGVLGSALGMDKLRAKQICIAHGIPTPEWRSVTSVDDARTAASTLGFPVIVKPVQEGSSIGVSKAMENEVVDAYENASQYGSVIMEKFVNGREVTAAVIGNEALPLVSMSTPRLFYDYQAKYHDDTTVYECPSPIGESLTREIQALALGAFEAIGASGWGRVDFILDQDQNPYFIELNTLPGMTDHSLVPMAAREAGLDFPELCLRILSMTLPVVDEVEA